MKSTDKHYQDARVTLRRLSDSEWLMFTEVDGSIAASVGMQADEKTALSRAETLAAWFDAELRVEKVGAESRDLAGGCDV